MNYQEMAANAVYRWEVDRPTCIAVDTETYGLLWRDKAFCVTISWHVDGTVYNAYFDLEQADTDGLKRILRRGCDTMIVMHNAKFDLQKLLLAGVLQRENLHASRLHDTQTLQHLLDEHAPKKLKDMARNLLGEETDEDETLRRVRRELKLTKEDGYGKIPRDVLVPYALKDSEYTLRLYEFLSPRLDKDLYPLYKREMELTLVLLDMEAAGMGIDVPYVREKVKEYGGRLLKHRRSIEQITGRKIFDESDLIPRPLPEVTNKRTHETKAAAKDRALRETFNPNSPAQVREQFYQFGILLEETSEASLKMVEHPLAAELVEMRKTAKIRTTYLQAMIHEQSNGVIHTSFRQNGTVTGRMSSGMSEG